MKLEVLEYYGAGYHVVELEEPKHDGADSWFRDEYQDVDEWCEQTFGPSDIWGAEPITGWKRMRNKYFFVEESKLSWFVLRWA